jgi:hypothetical protein
MLASWSSAFQFTAQPGFGNKAQRQHGPAGGAIKAARWVAWVDQTLLPFTLAVFWPNP